jgi:mono/diheme cytochrome c family protein
MRFRTLAPLFFLFVGASCARKPAPAAEKVPAAPISAASTSPVSASPAPEAPAAATPAPLPYEARMGKVTFAHYCQTCHGETGAGDGFNAFNLDPHPRDLSDPEFQKKKSDAELADAIRRGGAGVGLSALMPPWGHTLSDRQIGDVVLYVRTLPALRKPAS